MAKCVGAAGDGQHNVRERRLIMRFLDRIAIIANVFVDGLQVIGGGNLMKKRLYRWTDQRQAVLAQGVPTDQPIFPGAEQMKGLARADDADRAVLTAERAKRQAGYVSQFEAVIPIRIALDDLLVQLMQRFEAGFVQFFGNDNYQIDIADAGIEIAGDQRAVQVDANQPLAQDGAQAGGQLVQNGADIVLGSLGNGSGHGRSAFDAKTRCLACGETRANSRRIG